MRRVYVLIDPRTSEIRYVGQTKDTLDGRLRSHVHGANALSQAYKSFHAVAWIRQLRRMGYRPRIELVAEYRDEDVDEAERFWIAHFRERGCDLVNVMGDGPTLHSHSTESRARISANTYFRKMTAEEHKRGADAQRGKPHNVSPEGKERHRIAVSGPKLERRGKKHNVSPEGRERHRIAMARTKGRSHVVSSDGRERMRENGRHSTGGWEVRRQRYGSSGRRVAV